tara:strand:+ start:573 stop:902 length:330 start_codon:yes stop_codon:yes gene_type:complete
MAYHGRKLSIITTSLSCVNKQHAYEIASQALEARRDLSTDELTGIVDTPEQTVVSGPDGQTYFLEVTAQRVGGGESLRLTATVDLGNSFKLERIEESVDVEVNYRRHRT